MAPKASLSKKTTVLFSSNTVILALISFGVFQHWDQNAFILFLDKKWSQVWPWLLLYPIFLVTMPLMPRPARCNTGETKNAFPPSIAQAKVMLFCTATIDYAVTSALMLFWNSVCRLEDGNLCPFTAAGTLLVAQAVMPLKDDIQCRLIWRKFISPYKLNSWPYSWEASLDKASSSALFGCLSLLAFCLSDQVSFGSVLLPSIAFQIWLEAMLMLSVTEVLTHFAHRWMHEKAYFLHKKHHKASACVSCFHAPVFDLFDLVIEFGGGLPILCVLKHLLGLDSRVHLLSHHLWLVVATQIHSGNPYAVYFFNPILDHFARPTVCHNLHHTIQKDHYLFVPYSHFVSAESRHNDIEKYNKHMKTHFPSGV